ncbi:MULTISPECIES: Rho termination factor N-terminal domain-containing protein [unclassified Sphingobacterium]|uniref:Rho termination factor N-terminal domain-containing protein n=1 Tax=unclassified Sphingobacterium TaxID=2609468 RepID=UPI0025E6A879|nr:MULTISPECIES: Rho termination factor N-terminal domain-containing protein [unclassified Sphingobacterium]
MNTAKTTSHATAKGQSRGKSTDSEKSMKKSNGKNTSVSKNGQHGTSDKTKDELLQMAKKLEITGRHDMTKDELIKAIDKHGKK